MENNINKERISFVKIFLYTVIATSASVVLPMLVHAVGVLTGTDAALGQILLPMHIPVLVLGFCMGPWAGLAAGALSPVISYLITGMPSLALLPCMIAEIAAYGILAGFFRDMRLNSVCKILSVQILGRLARVLTASVIMFITKKETVFLLTNLKSMIWGLPGIILQLVIVSLIIRKTGRGKEHE